VSAITGIIQATQATPQTTSSTSYVDISCETSALSNGVRYFVTYHCGQSADSTSRLAHSQLLHGATQVAQGGGEGWSAGAPYGVPQTQGFFTVVGNGSDTLKFQGKVNAGTGTFGAMWIIAIPMTDFGAENTDWWYSGTDSDSLEVDDAGTGSFTTIRTETWTLPAEDVLVFASVEVQPTTGAGTEDVQVRLRIAGTSLDRIHVQECEDPSDRMCPAWATLATGLSGSTTFLIDLISVGAAVFDARRSRIFVVRKDVFNQVVTDGNTANNQSTSTTYADVSGYGATIVPTETAYVLAIANHVLSNSSVAGACRSRIHNQTDNTNFGTDTGQPPANQSQDEMVTIVAACEQRSASTEYRVQIAAAVAAQTAELGGLTGTIDSELLLIELSTAAAAPAPTMDPIMMGAVF
jgi:hypothetical protein